MNFENLLAVQLESTFNLSKYFESLLAPSYATRLCNWPIKTILSNNSVEENYLRSLQKCRDDFKNTSKVKIDCVHAIENENGEVALACVHLH